MRIGFYGGSFDPIHLGHLILAQEARIAAALDRIILIPAARAPLRDAPPATDPRIRLDLCKRATADLTYIEVSDFEVGRQTTTFTCETVDHFARQHPSDDLFWILGADQFEKLHLWKNPDFLTSKLTFLVARRNTDEIHPPPLSDLRSQLLPPRRIDITSTEIRHRIPLNQPWEALVPAPVATAIHTLALYRPPSRNPKR